MLNMKFFTYNRAHLAFQCTCKSNKEWILHFNDVFPIELNAIRLALAFLEKSTKRKGVRGALLLIYPPKMHNIFPIIHVPFPLPSIFLHQFLLSLWLLFIQLVIILFINKKKVSCGCYKIGLFPSTGYNQHY